MANASVAAGGLAMDDLKDRPTCPTVMFEENSQQYTMHLQKLDVNIECFVSTAVVNMRGEWTNQTDKKVSFYFRFVLPNTKKSDKKII